MPKLSRVVFLLCLMCLSGCGLIFGTNQPINLKNNEYATLRLGKEPNWQLLPPSAKNGEDTSDLAYKHQKTGAIISLNSVCRLERNQSLEDLTKSLLFGLAPDSKTRQNKMIVDGVEALETTVETVQNNEHTVQVRTVVLKKSGCTYDFMLVSPVQYFEGHVAIFNRFLNEFHSN